MLLVITAVAVVALVVSCVAIAISIITKSDGESKRLDGHEKRLDAIEQELKIHGKDHTPQISEIKPLSVFQISTHIHGSITYIAERAIDGDEDTTMTTKPHTNPWWCADLGGIYHVKMVVVINIKKQEGVLKRRCLQPSYKPTCWCDKHKPCGWREPYPRCLHIMWAEAWIPGTVWNSGLSRWGYWAIHGCAVQHYRIHACC